MRMQDMILISVDDHIIEPPTMFDKHTPARYKGRMPRNMRTKDGLDAWVVPTEGFLWNASGLNAVMGRRKEEYGMDPTGYSEMRKGCWDVKARIDDQNVNGTLATLNFGTFPLFSGVRFLEYKDKDLALATVRAYNDWHIQEWCAYDPARFIPLAHMPMWDPNLCAEEVRRVNKLGCHALTLPPNPTRHGLPSFHSDHWDPLWKACDELGVVTCLHIGDATGAVTSNDAPVDVFISNMPVTLYATASDLVYSPILRKFNNIKFALTEGGAGWAPHFMERADYVNQQHGAWTNQKFGGKKPSDLFKEHVQLCFIDDRTAIKTRYDCGIDILTFETDYPHSDCQFPHSPEVLWESVKDIPDEDINKITHLNAMRFYNFDPFRHRPREKCTVGALRAEATHVNLDYIETGRALNASVKGQIVTWEMYAKQNPVEIVEQIEA
ncbi:MAG: amidohydrolase family protein [Gammaproteobacteria bacterium]